MNNFAGTFAERHNGADCAQFLTKRTRRFRALTAELQRQHNKITQVDTMRTFPLCIHLVYILQLNNFRKRP